MATVFPCYFNHDRGWRVLAPLKKIWKTVFGRWWSSKRVLKPTIIGLKVRHCADRQGNADRGCNYFKQVDGDQWAEMDLELTLIGLLEREFARTKNNSFYRSLGQTWFHNVTDNWQVDCAPWEVTILSKSKSLMPLTMGVKPVCNCLIFWSLERLAWKAGNCSDI